MATNQLHYKMSALLRTLAELDALNALSDSLKQRIDKSVMEARVALEKMAVAFEDDREDREDREFKEPEELTALKELDIDPSELARLKIIERNFKKLTKANSWKILELDRDDGELVEFLLRYVDPSIMRCGPIRYATGHGFVETVKQLLKDTRVDPSENDNSALNCASDAGKIEIVKLLLADPRVLARDLNRSLRYANQHGHVEIVELLKAHGCVLPQ